MSSCSRIFDEAVVKYFNVIKVEDGEVRRTPQIAMAIPSRQTFDIELNNENTPILPLIVITRVGKGEIAESNIVRKHRTRPIIMTLNKNQKAFSGIELMPWLYNYQVDYFSLTKEMFEDMDNQIAFRLKKHNWVKAINSLNDTTITSNAYLYNVSFSDATTYTEVADTTNRIFHGSANFTIYGYISNEEYATRSVLKIDETISLKKADDTVEMLINRIINADGTIETKYTN